MRFSSSFVLLTAILFLSQASAFEPDEVSPGTWMVTDCVNLALGELLDTDDNVFIFARTFRSDALIPLEFCFGSEVDCAKAGAKWFPGTPTKSADGTTAYLSPKSLVASGLVTVRALENATTQLCTSSVYFARDAKGTRLVSGNPKKAKLGATTADRRGLSQKTARDAVAKENADTDPFGFVSWLNKYRAQAGLGPVAHDPTLTEWAKVNNQQQVARGIGHFVMGTARRQNSAWAPTIAQTETMWVQSPGHNSALLDPNIRFVGIAASGTPGAANVYWTYNAN